jgi:hypothetical protein
MNKYMSAETITAIGIDIDGTITEDPVFFSEIARKLRLNGTVVHVVTARDAECRQETEDELFELDIEYDELYLLPPMEVAIAVCPHNELEWFLRHFWLKVDYAQRNHLSHFIDDNERVMQLFSLYAPEIKAIPVTERHSLLFLNLPLKPRS